MGVVKNQMQNTGEPMPKFFTGLDFFFFFWGGGGGCKFEGGEKKMQISGEPMPIFFFFLPFFYS